MCGPTAWSLAKRLIFVVVKASTSVNAIFDPEDISSTLQRNTDIRE